MNQSTTPWVVEKAGPRVVITVLADCRLAWRRTRRRNHPTDVFIIRRRRKRK